MKTKLMIAGVDVDASAGATFERANPITGDTVTTAAAAGLEEAEQAVEAAQTAFPEWSALAPSRRRELLNAAAQQILDDEETFVSTMVAETGATPGWARHNVKLGAGMLREAAAMVTQVRGDILPSDKSGYTSLIFRKPVGVCLAIAPWNAPIILGVRSIAMPLACGNTVVMKTSEQTPATQMLIGHALRRAGVPAGVVNILTVAEEDNPAVVEAMIAHPAVRRVNFTGSSRVGRIVGELAGRHLKPALLELGGKAPFIVLPDANLNEAARAAAFGAFMHQGQICMSTERLIVHESVADAFVDRLLDRANALTAADPATTPATPLASLVDRVSAERVAALIADAEQNGSKVRSGGKIAGTFLSATVVDGVTPAMRLYREESFGPIASIIRYGDGDDPVAIANESDYGLASAIFTQDVTRALAMAKRIDAGACHINGPTVQDEAHVPLGGVKSSGFGRFGGMAGVHEFTDICWVTIEEHGQTYPI